MSDIDLDLLLDRIDGPLMWSHLEQFSRWTKEAGSQGELSSLDYIQKIMAGYGYQTELIMHPAYISLPRDARVVSAGKTIRCISHSFSQNSASAGTSGELVYIGGGTPEDFEVADVAGKIVLVDGIANPGVSRLASQAGAIGQLHISPHEHVHEMCISPVWGSPTHETVPGHPSTVVVTVALDDGEDLKRKLATDGALALTLHAEVDTGWRQTPILVADLPGPSGEADEPYLLFTGHHDTWYYGVMDNGGANATMMEVGRLCAENRRRWGRALRIIFWSGHSQGRYSSSTWYADENWDEIERRAVAHVNVDSTGGQGNTVVADATSSSELAALARTVLMDQGGQEFTGRRNGRGGDQSFWGIGVPAIFGNMGEQPAGSGANASAAVFGTGNRKGAGTGWWWHTPDDLLDKMDMQLLIIDTRIYMHTVWRLLTDPVLPLSYREHAQMLAKELSALQEDVGDRFDLSLLITLTTRLQELTGKLEAAAGDAESSKAGRINAGLMAVSRALVPVDYALGDRFGHDPALAQNTYPVLDSVRLMAATDPNSDAVPFITVAMTRARNRVASALRQANSALDQTLADLTAH